METLPKITRRKIGLGPDLFRVHADPERFWIGARELVDGGLELGACRYQKFVPGWRRSIDRVISYANVRGSYSLRCAARLDAWIAHLA